MSYSKEQRVWDAGYLAGAKGRDISVCPFGATSIWLRTWRDGYRIAAEPMSRTPAHSGAPQ